MAKHAVVGKHGTVAKEGRSSVVRCRGGDELLKFPGVECENPRAPKRDRVYRKVFRKKRIFLPDQEDLALEYLSGDDVIVVGMTGYSILTPEQCRAYGVRPGAYENACMDVFGSLIKVVQHAFAGVRVKIADGAS